MDCINNALVKMKCCTLNFKKIYIYKLKIKTNMKNKYTEKENDFSII